MTENKGIYEKLLNIQAELVCGKSQYNSFGGYSYRSSEDILEALKPLLKAQKCVVNLHDCIEQIGDRYYVKAVASLIDIANGDSISSTAYAREEESQKGMAASQITGSTSSYARKYALNGLFAIDDMKDADSTNTHEETSKNTPQNKPLDKPKPMSIEEAGAIVVQFGKYKNKTLKEIASIDSQYLDWLANNSTKAEVKLGASKMLLAKEIESEPANDSDLPF